MDNIQQPSWMSALSRCLEQGSADQTLIVYLDEILSWWLAQDLTTQSSEITPLISKLGESGVKVSFEEFVDQLLIANPVNYQKLFPPELSKPQAKSRYRQLIRVFHPDRGVKGEAWLTYRAERVNTAYAAFSKLRSVHQAAKPKQNSGRKQAPQAMSISSLGAGSKPSPSKPKRRIIMPINMRDIRRWLGSPERFQKKIVTWGLGLAALFVVLLLLSALVA